MKAMFIYTTWNVENVLAPIYYPNHLSLLKQCWKKKSEKENKKVLTKLTIQC